MQPEQIHHLLLPQQDSSKLLTPEVVAGIEKMLYTPEVQEYLRLRTADILIQNCVDMEINTQKDGPVFIKGVSRGVLALYSTLKPTK